MTADASTPSAAPGEEAAPAATPIPPVPRWLAFKEAFGRTYLTIDPRTLGLARIVISLLFLFDLWHRAHGGIELWYSKDNDWIGLLSTTEDGRKLTYRIK